MRRRRRRSAFARQAPQWTRFAIWGVGAAAFLGLFLFFMRQADVLAPAPRPMQVELPNAFKD